MGGLWLFRNRLWFLDPRRLETLDQVWQWYGTPGRVSRSHTHVKKKERYFYRETKKRKETKRQETRDERGRESERETGR